MKVMFSMYDDIRDCAAPKTLCDWVKNFRMKKMQMKRKVRTGGDLRVCAIMSTALLSAENQLRLKQQDRLNRCLQLQSKFNEKLCSSSNIGYLTTSLTTPMHYSAIDHCREAMDQKEGQKRRVEICNLWREELNGLDEFMRKMSSNSSSRSTDIENRTCSESAYKNEANSLQRHSIAVSS